MINRMHCNKFLITLYVICLLGTAFVSVEGRKRPRRARRALKTSTHYYDSTQNYDSKDGDFVAYTATEEKVKPIGTQKDSMDSAVVAEAAVADDCDPVAQAAVVDDPSATSEGTTAGKSRKSGKTYGISEGIASDKSAKGGGAYGTSEGVAAGKSAKGGSAYGLSGTSEGTAGAKGLKGSYGGSYVASEGSPISKGKYGGSYVDSEGFAVSKGKYGGQVLETATEPPSK